MFSPPIKMPLSTQKKNLIWIQYKQKVNRHAIHIRCDWTKSKNDSIKLITVNAKVLYKYFKNTISNAYVGRFKPFGFINLCVFLFVPDICNKNVYLSVQFNFFFWHL